MTSTNSNESYCTFTLSGDLTAGGLPSEVEIRKDLEDSDPQVKRHALRAAIMVMLGGESMPGILMQVIRYCINSQDKSLKKLCMLYWEVVPKYQEPTSSELLSASSGGLIIQRKLLPEMILVCNALMNDLNHANEYVRGSMLKFLCKLKDEEILSPLVSSIKACLQHPHAYVRKNAVMAVFHAHKLFGNSLIPDAPEIIHLFLLAEKDMAARRNAFLMLLNQDEKLAVEFLANNINDVNNYGDGFSLLVLELTRRICRREPCQKSRFVRVLVEMLSSNSSAVSYEASWTLVSLSSAPTAVRAVVGTYIDLLNSHNDNNVKMIVLERLIELKKNHSKILQELLMDLLRVLSSPNSDICKKVLDVSKDIVTARNVTEVVNTLKREIIKTNEDDFNVNQEKGVAYRGMLIRAIHRCAIRFPQVADTVVHILMDFLFIEGGIQVVIFLREIIEHYPPLRSSILSKLLDNFSRINKINIMCVCLWIIGEHCDTASILEEAFDHIVNQLGDACFVNKCDNSYGEEHSTNVDVVTSKKLMKNTILSDGTYATQTVYTEIKRKEDNTPYLRKMLLSGDGFLGSIVSSCLTKLCLRSEDMVDKFSSAKIKDMTLKSTLYMCAIVEMTESVESSHKSSFADCYERITFCCRTLLDLRVKKVLKPLLLTKGKATFAKLMENLKQKDEAEVVKVASNKPSVQADDQIYFRQLRLNTVLGGEFDLDDGDHSDLARATGYTGEVSLLGDELSRVYQLSGFADPVYVEALVIVHDYDISLDIFIINRTPNTLSNLTVELNTMGDMKIVERPQSQTIGPHDQITVNASIKVSSTETGQIFGTIVYHDSSTQDRKYININDIHMDIMDYIRPASCTDEMFRSMWAEFEWENKVAISTTITELSDFLDHVIASTNMSCLTPHDGDDKVSFMAANLYAQSVFGEDVLVNVSAEKKEDNDGKLAGYIRIRSKTQGIALSLGDRMTIIQRSFSML